jgi:hypothetical protein
MLKKMRRLLSTPTIAAHKVIGRLLHEEGAPLAHVEIELWDRDLLFDDFLSRGATNEHGHFELAYDPGRAGAFDIPDLELRIIERTNTARRVAHRIKGDDNVAALVYDFGSHKLPGVRNGSPGAPRSSQSDFGMPKTNPLCLPMPYSKSIHARQFVASVDPQQLVGALPPCLEIVPGLEELAMIGVMDYPASFSMADPTGAIYQFQELVIAAFVREVQDPSRIGLFFIAVYISTDVAVVVGREMFGFPKKQAEVTIGERQISVRRSGLPPEEASGFVRPIEILQGTWESGAANLSSIQERLLLLGTRGAAFGMNHLFELPFYNHQMILAPTTPDGQSPFISRVWRAPLADVRVKRSSPLHGACFRLSPSKTDPLYLLAPGTEPIIKAEAGIEMEVNFTMKEASLIADYSAPFEYRPSLSEALRESGRRLISRAGAHYKQLITHGG